MNKQELVAKISQDCELTPKQANAALNALLKIVTETLSKKEEVMLIGFGTFKVTERAARTGRNPSTGEVMAIPARQVPSFKPGAKLKEAINAQ